MGWVGRENGVIYREMALASRNLSVPVCLCLSLSTRSLWPVPRLLLCSVVFTLSLPNTACFRFSVHYYCVYMWEISGRSNLESDSRFSRDEWVQKRLLWPGLSSQGHMYWCIFILYSTGEALLLI